MMYEVLLIDKIKESNWNIISIVYPSEFRIVRPEWVKLNMVLIGTSWLTQSQSSPKHEDRRYQILYQLINSLSFALLSQL